MRPFTSRFAIGTALLVATTLGSAGCYYSKETEKVGQAPPPVVMQSSAQRVYNYPEGRYELQGDGSRQKPYYWVWIPTGVQSVPPAPPPPPHPQR